MMEVFSRFASVNCGRFATRRLAIGKPFIRLLVVMSVSTKRPDSQSSLKIMNFYSSLFLARNAKPQWSYVTEIEYQMVPLLASQCFFTNEKLKEVTCSIYLFTRWCHYGLGNKALNYPFLIYLACKESRGVELISTSWPHGRVRHLNILLMKVLLPKFETGKTHNRQHPTWTILSRQKTSSNHSLLDNGQAAKKVTWLMKSKGQLGLSDADL